MSSIADADRSTKLKSMTYLVVISSVVSNKEIMPDGKNGGSTQQNIGVVQFMVVGNPVPDQSPEGFHVGISSDTGDLLWFATYT